MTPEEFRVDVLGQVEAAGDAVDRARLANEWDIMAQRVVRELARVKRQAVREMHRLGFTWVEIGETLGLSKQRAHQIAWGDPRRGGQRPPGSAKTASDKAALKAINARKKKAT
jgi:hypothetical protein